MTSTACTSAVTHLAGLMWSQCSDIIRLGGLKARGWLQPLPMDELRGANSTRQMAQVFNNRIQMELILFSSLITLHT